MESAPTETTMQDRVSTALQHLHAALTGIEFYFRDHPAVTGNRDRASLLLASTLAESGEITVSLVGTQVVVGQEVLPSSRQVREGLMEGLARRGFNRIQFLPGLTSEDTTAFLAALAAPASQPWACTAQHIHASAAVAGTASASQHKTPSSTVGHSASARSHSVTPQLLSHRETVGRLWNQCLSRHNPDPTMLDSIVVELASAIAPNVADLIPLAELKRHDEYTFAHTINVAIMSAALAEVCGLPRRDIHDITTAAVLHDVGKGCVPQALLNKNGQLTEDEREVMRSHPVEGAKLLLESRDVTPLAPIVAFEHHMHPDGSGYPTGLGTRNLHIASRIVQVADVFDALRTDRPYRAALTVEQAREIMTKDAGVKYDPVMLNAFFDRVVARSTRDAAADGTIPTPLRRAA